MSTITDKKITDGQRNAVWVQHQQDRLTGTPQQNKAVFDEYSELIREHFNEAMDVLDARISTNDSDIEELKEINVRDAAESARESAEIASESAQTTQDMLGRVISISNKIYTKSWDVEQEQDEFVFSAEGYTYNESDTYEVFVNGLKLSESEYTRNEDSVVLGSSISAGNTVEIIVTTNLKGKGIADTELNDDYTLTINYDDGTSTTTESIRGEKGDKGDGVGRLGQRQIVNELFNARYVGHMGFCGYIKETTSKPSVQSNSLMALDLAKSVGIKFVETDTTVLSDGTWVISHDANTSGMSGDLADLKSIDLANFKSRKVIKEYLTSGTYWTYAQDEQYDTITLEEYLLRAKELGLYVLPEVKYIDGGYTSANWQSFADTVKSCGMENNIIIYVPYTSYMRGAYEYLPNTPVCYTSIKADDVDDLIVELKKYPFAMGATGQSDYSTILEKCIEANIPLGLWTVDDYEKAKKFIADGGTFVVTDCLTDKIDTKQFIVDYECDMDSFSAKANKYAASGSSTYSDGVLSVVTSSTNEVYLRQFPIKPMDIVYVSCDVKSDGVKAEVLVNNQLSSTQKRTVLKSSVSKDWQHIECIYIAGQDDTAVDVGMNGVAITSGTEGTAYFKNVIVKFFTKDITDKWTVNDHIAYSYRNGVVTVVRDSNATIANSGWTKVGKLPRAYYPTKNLEFPAMLGGTGQVNGMLKVDIYGDVSVYAPSAQNTQYYAVSYAVV